MRSHILFFLESMYFAEMVTLATLKSESKTNLP